MEPTTVIKAPRVTEKGTFFMSEQNKYTFVVDPRATKTQIKDAVEKIYKVKVQGVNTQIKKGKRRRFKYGVRVEKDMKTAIVRLAEGSTIELF